MKRLPCTQSYVAFLALAISACATAPVPAAAPTAPPPSAKAAPKPATATAPVAATAEPPPQTETATEASTAPTAPAETTKAVEPVAHPLDVLTGRETAFLIDYANSGADAYARKTCEASAGSSAKEGSAKEGDEEARRRSLVVCLQKERVKFTADVLRFRKDESGRGTLTIYRRVNSSLPEVYVAKVAYKELDAHRVNVVIKGGMSGARPICRDKTDLEVTVPNGYSIELTDPIYGKLTYEAKIGLVAN